MPTPERREDMGELVTEIARALVDIPEEVRLEAVEGPEATAFRLHVAPSDTGKVIGKQGRIARSIRILLGAVSVKHRHRYTLDVIEEGHSAPPKVD